MLERMAPAGWAGPRNVRIKLKRLARRTPAVDVPKGIFLLPRFGKFRKMLQTLR